MNTRVASHFDVSANQSNLLVFCLADLLESQHKDVKKEPAV